MPTAYVGQDDVRGNLLEISEKIRTLIKVIMSEDLPQSVSLSSLRNKYKKKTFQNVWESKGDKSVNALTLFALIHRQIPKK